MAKKKKTIEIQNPVPDSPELWMPEIAMAFKGAQEFMKSGLVPAEDSAEITPWSLAPLLCMATRGADMDSKLLDVAATMSFNNFLMRFGEEEAQNVPPILAFAYCYLGAHIGLELLKLEAAEEVFDLAEANLELLEQLASEAEKIIEKNNPFEFGPE